MIKKELDNEVGLNDFTPGVQLYYHDLQKYKPIPKEEEKELLIKAKNGDIKARNKIISSNLRFVFQIAKKYRGHGVDIADLINAGNDGMMHALELFDVTQDVKFYSYAVWWIRQKMGAAIKEYKEETDRQTSFDTIFNDGENNYDNIYYDDDDDAYGNDVSDEGENEYITNEETEQKKIVVQKLLAKLDDRQRVVIEKFYGINNDEDVRSLQEISKDLGICSERVRQIKSQALDELRAEVFDIEEAEFLFR